MSGEAIVTIRDRQWFCSVASTPAELARGLSGVPSMPPGTGMLFVLGYEQIVTVTTEGMLFPLDVIFVGDNLLVTEVAFNLMPGDYGTTSLPCRYFLEVNAGEAHGIETTAPVGTEFLASPTTNWMAPVVTLAGMVLAGAFMAKMGKAMADAVFGRPKARPVLYGTRGELLPQTGAKGQYRVDADGIDNKPEALAGMKGKPTAVIPTGPRPPRPGKEKLEFLPDSPEFLAYTIDDIGYREKLDNAFQQAIARARQGR